MGSSAKAAGKTRTRGNRRAARPRGRPRRRKDLRLPPLFEVRFGSLPRPDPLSDLLQREGAEAHLIACRLTDRTPRRLVRWLDVETDPERIPPLLEGLRRQVRTRRVALAELAPGRVLVRTSEPAPAICSATYGVGGICVTCPLMAHVGRQSWEVILPRGARTNALLRGFVGGKTARPAIGRVAPHRTETALTRHQDRALRVAYELGYFAYPRRGTLGDVARALGSGRSATLEVLRRATVKLAGRRYGDELGSRGTLDRRLGPRRTVQ